MSVKTQEDLHNQQRPLSKQDIVSDSGFSILLPHLCSMPTASISPFLHSVLKSKWTCTFWVPLPCIQKPHHVFLINHCGFILLNVEVFYKPQKRPDWFLCLLLPLALVTYFTASAEVEQKGGVEQEHWLLSVMGTVTVSAGSSLRSAQMEGCCTLERAGLSWRDFTDICHKIVMWLIYKSMITMDVNGAPQWPWVTGNRRSTSQTSGSTTGAL